MWVGYGTWREEIAMRHRPARKRVTFTLAAPEARAVSVCGTFNDWGRDCHPLRKDGCGRWTLQLLMPPGTYEYRFRVDGEWTDDPACTHRVPNSFGTENCVLEVRAG